MKTSTCHICHQSVLLDDSGRLEKHNRFPRPKDWEPCPGSGSTPQAHDGAEKAEETSGRVISLWCRIHGHTGGKLCDCFVKQEDGTYQHGMLVAQDAAKSDILTQARAKIAGLEKDKLRLDWLEQQLNAPHYWRDVVLAWDHEDGFWVARIKRGDYVGAMPVEYVAHHPDLRSALDAARDKKW